MSKAFPVTRLIPPKNLPHTLNNSKQPLFARKCGSVLLCAHFLDIFHYSQWIFRCRSSLSTLYLMSMTNSRHALSSTHSQTHLPTRAQRAYNTAIISGCFPRIFIATHLMYAYYTEFREGWGVTRALHQK